MARIIKLKNTTVSDIIIFGWTLEPSIYFIVDPIEYVEFARNDTLFGYVSTGEIIVNNGDVDFLFPTEGWRHILGEPNDLAVNDGVDALRGDNNEGLEATNGVLIHGVSGDDKISVINTNANNELSTSNTEMNFLLERILKELQKTNMYNAISHDMYIDNRDIGDR